MPFKDPDKKRECARAYRQRQRDLKNLWGPVTKCFICPIYPAMQLMRGITFTSGFFITGDPETQARIESHENFGRLIYGWRCEP